MRERAPQRRQPERLPHHERMQRDRHHQRLLEALLDHLVEAGNDHVGEIVRQAVAVNDGGASRLEPCVYMFERKS